VPDELDVMNACFAIFWEAPSNPKGIILRYEIEIGNIIQMVPVTQHFLTIDQSQREMNVLIRVSVHAFSMFENNISLTLNTGQSS